MTVIVVRVASAAMSRRSPSLQRPSPTRRLDEHRPLRLDRGRREAGGDDPPLLAPQLAVGGQQPAADDRVEQALDDVGLGIIGRVVEQHMLDHVGVEQDMDGEAEDVALQMVGLERELGPAIDRGPRPLPEEAAPAGDRLGPARRMRRDEAGRLTPPLIAPPHRRGRPRPAG